MQDHSKMAGKIKAQITRFAHQMALGFKRPDKKFICQMLYGIQASKDVKLSNIARALGEEIALIKTEARLSRNVGKAGRQQGQVYTSDKLKKLWQ